MVDDSRNPHQFYYYEADRCISGLLSHRMVVLELGCGTAGSTTVHVGEVSRIVAMDVSREMVRRARRALRGVRKGERVGFIVADVAHLPFRAGVFDAVVSRGVVLSYTADPRLAIREAHRVLRKRGRLGIDVMNYQPDWPEPARAFHKRGRDWMYTETRVVGGRQIRSVYQISPTCPYAHRTKGRHQAAYATSLPHRPSRLRKYGVRVGTFEAWMFKPEEITRLVARNGFRDVEVTPLGILPRTLWSGDRRLKEFVVRNKNRLSDLSLLLSRQWRPESALHLFVHATRN